MLSYGNAFTEINLIKSPNTLITAPNSSGKSTLLDALTFALYGKPFRRVKKEQLVNSINQKNMVVELEFSAYGQEYKIIRGMRPNVFEIYRDGNLLDQSASVRDYQETLERNILRMNIRSFTQIVILGSASFVPFMQLKPDVRREVIEDLLDIKVFSTMNLLLKQRAQKAREELLLLETNIESHNKMIKIHTDHYVKIETDNENRERELKEKIELLEERIENYNTEAQSIQANIINLTNSIMDEESTKKRMRKIESLKDQLDSKRNNLQKGIKFYTENNNCPTCDSEITNELKNKKIDEKKESILELEDALNSLDEETDILKERALEIAKISTELSELYNKRLDLSNNIKIATNEIQFLEKQLNEKPKNENNFAEIEKLRKEILDFETQLEALTKRRELYDIASGILRDSGVKAKIIKQYVPIINTLVNKYLAAMDFFVKFELDENFNEKILSRHRDDFTYDSFSEGEKSRIDLALLFTWRTIARMKNSANSNLLILDEVFDSSLDANGCEEFMKLIHSLENANVFVISHRGDILQDKFRSAIRVEKHSNFSRIV